MKKSKKIAIWIISVFVVLTLLAYLSVCLLSKKPGMNGFAVTNNMIKMLVLDKDYVKVGENRYLYREGALKQLIKNEYDSCTVMDYFNNGWRFNNGVQPEMEDLEDSELIKYSLVIKDGETLKGGGVTVWSFDYHSVYYRPFDEQTKTYTDSEH